MSKFTEGKWEYDEPLGVVYSDETNMVIANVHGAGTGSCFCLTPEGQANARLIVAAPEMYGELYETLQLLLGKSSYEGDEFFRQAMSIKELMTRIDGEEGGA